MLFFYESYKVRFYLLLSFCFMATVAFKPITTDAATALPPAKDAEIEINDFHNLLIDVMKKGEKADCQFRYKLLLPEIRKRFDMPLISRIVLGSWWRKITIDEKLAFIDLFNQFTAATYADRFKRFNGHKFEIISSEESRKDRALVETVLKTKGHDEVPLSYICRKTTEGWKIVGVSARGVNDLSLKRAEYNEYISKHGFNALLKMIKKKCEACIPKKENIT